MDPTQRFSSRVENYAKFRPDYPSMLIAELQRTGALPRSGTLVELGSGTGIFTRRLLDAGYQVQAVEPNAPMRAVAESSFASHAGFVTIAGSAEATTLPDACADGLVAAQAFHWFRIPETRREALRVLKPGAPAVLIWNQRRESGDPFHEGYEALLQQFGTDYNQVGRRQSPPGVLEEFFGAEPQVVSLANSQRLDSEGLRGRLLSCSYVPVPGHPSYEPMLEALDVLFDRLVRDGFVEMIYDTRAYFGPLAQ